MGENNELENALEDLSTIVNGLGTKAPDGSPDWERRKIAATSLRDLLAKGKVAQIVDDVITEAEGVGGG